MTTRLIKTSAMVALSALILSGCVSSREGSPKDYFLNFAFEPPKGDVVTVCHGYGCRIKTPFSIEERDLQHIRGIMSDFEGSPETERDGVQKVISYFEQRVGKAIGTDKDRAKIETGGINNPSQQDCIDEATNTTSYLMVMARHGLLQHHVVRRPEVRGYWVDGKWPHWTAVLQQESDKEEWAVDTWFRDNGVPPVVIPLADWYKFDEERGEPDEPYPAAQSNTT